MSPREQFKNETGEDATYQITDRLCEVNYDYVKWLEAKFTSYNSDYQKLRKHNDSRRSNK